MVEFILEQGVKFRAADFPGQAQAHVLRHEARVPAPRHRENAQRMPSTPEMVHQQAVVQVPAGRRVERSVDDQTETHQSASRNAAHAESLSHSRTVTAPKPAVSVSATSDVHRILAKFSSEGLSPAKAGSSLRMRSRYWSISPSSRRSRSTRSTRNPWPSSVSPSTATSSR